MSDEISTQSQPPESETDLEFEGSDGSPDTPEAPPGNEESDTCLATRGPGVLDVVVDEGSGRVNFLMDHGGHQKVIYGDGVTLLPPPARELPWEPLPGDGAVSVYQRNTISPARLFRTVESVLRGACELPTPDFYPLFAAWVFGTYKARDWFRFYPTIYLFSDRERGKTRTASALVGMAYRGIALTAFNEPVLFRYAEQHAPTFFLDISRLNKALREARRLGEVLLALAEKAGKVPRTDVRTGVTHLFRPYSPTVLASNELAEGSPFLSRCLLVIMPTGKRYYPAHAPDYFKPVREMLLAWHWRSVSERQKPPPDVEGLGSGRWRDVTEPLREITALVAPDRLDAVDRALAYLHEQRRRAQSGTFEADVIRAVRLASGAVGGWRLATGDILERLHSLPDMTNVTSKRLGDCLAALGFEGTKIDWDGHRNARRGWYCDPELVAALVQKYGAEDE